MLKDILRYFTNPFWPMITAIVLYSLIAGGYIFQGRPWFGGMWVCYALAIICMIMDTK